MLEEASNDEFVLAFLLSAVSKKTCRRIGVLGSQGFFLANDAANDSLKLRIDHANDVSESR